MTRDQYLAAVAALLDEIGLRGDLREQALQMAMRLPHSKQTIDDLRAGWLDQRRAMNTSNN